MRVGAPAWLLVWGLATGGCTREEAPAPLQPLEVDEATDPNGASPLRFEDGPRKNLVFISIDTLRKDAIGFYGGNTDTDFMDQILSESVRLDDHMQCSSWTYPSTSCTLMGRSHEANGYMPELTQDQEPLPDDSEFLAQWLGDAGFVSLIHTGNDWLSGKWGNTRGYDMERFYSGDSVASAGEAADELLAEVADRGAEHWFLHLHMLEPHAPYNPPPSYLEGIEDLPDVPFDLSKRDVQYDVNRDRFQQLPAEIREAVEAHLRFRYEADVAWTDDRLEGIFAQLDARGMLDDALVVLWTDHGEAFWEHGHQTHAWTLFPEENHAVLAFWGRGLEPMTWSGPTHAVDLAPTVLQHFGVDLPERVDGVPLGFALDDRVRYASVSARGGPVQLVRQGDDALYYTWRTASLRLVDLASDPEALGNEVGRQPRRTQALWNELKPWTATLNGLLPDEAPAPPPMVH